MLTKEYIITFAKKANEAIEIKQLRSLITAYCILNGTDVDTWDWDSLMYLTYNEIVSEELKQEANIENVDAFDMFMSEDLI